MFKLAGLLLILEYVLEELRWEAALEDFREHSDFKGDTSCPFVSFPFPFN